MSALRAGVPDGPDRDAVLGHHMDNLSTCYSEPSFSFSQFFLLDEPPEATELSCP